MEKESFKRLFKDELLINFSDLVEGAAEDVEKYMTAIANDVTEAAALGDLQLIGELKGQVSALAETHRLRLARETIRSIQSVVAVAGAVAAGFVRGILS